MGVVYCGLDLGSSVCEVVGMQGDGTVVVREKFVTSEANLIGTLESIDGEVHVHMEASELASWVRGVLKGRVARIVVSHPKSNAWIAKDPLKGDRLDAYKLAELLRMGRIHEVYYPGEDHRMVFKQVVQHYDDVTGQEVRLKLKIKARLRAQGVIPRGERVYTPEGRKGYLRQVNGCGAREAIGQLYGLLDETLQAQGKARRLMGRLAQRYPEIRRFKGVPGVGPIGACRFSGYIQTPDRFRTKRKLWRYCRLGITDRTSDGKPLGYKALDRNGNGRLKDMSRKAFGAAMRRRESNAFQRAYRRTLQRTHNAVHARLSTQRKILTTLWVIWKGGTRYRDDKG